MTPKVNLLVDLNNLGFITRFVCLPMKPNPRRLDKYADQVLFVSMVKFILGNIARHKCDGLIIAADSKNVWRKDIYPDYKKKDANDDPYYSAVLKAADMVYEVFEKYTAAHTLRVPRCEADDIIGWWCLNSTNESVILSNDSDYKQLHGPLVRQFSPTKKSFVETEDGLYELFFKTVRGDRNDNIRSAYPRVKSTVIREAYDDPIAMMNFMETILKDGTKVGDNFDFNSSLISLRGQPSLIKTQIATEINNHITQRFDQIGVIGYIGKTVGAKTQTDLFDEAPNAVRKPPELLRSDI